MASQKSNTVRIDVKYFEGVNRLVGDNINKKEEFYHVENARSDIIGTISKRQGFTRLGNAITATANYAIFYFENDTATNYGFYRISRMSTATTIYYLNNTATWTALTGNGTGLTTARMSTTLAENCCFIVNNVDANRYISADGSTVTTSATATGHLYNSPIANKINAYKDRLYLGDYTDTTRYKTGIMMSSKPLGIVSLIDGDNIISGSTEITVTDTKYVYTGSNTLDVYRGGSKVGVITVTAKTQTTITGTVAFEAGFATPLLSSDELWVAGTYTGERMFRWADNPESGEDVKRYDTFKLTGSQNDRIRMFTNIGDVMMIGNKNNLSVWNDSNLQNFDLGIGCVSDTGYTKALGTLYFLHYTGLYSTTGGVPTLESAKINPYITGASKAVLEAACMGRKGTNVFCSLSSTTLYKPDGSIDRTLSNVVLEKDLITNNWYVHTGIKVTEFMNYPQTDDADALEFASTETGYHIYTFLTGQLDDSTKEILFRADTGNIKLAQNFEEFVYPKEIIVKTQRGSNIQCFISLDNEPFYEVKGQIVKGVTVLPVTGRNENDSEPPRCHQLSISLRDVSKKLCTISQIAISYVVSNEVEIPHSE